MTFEAASEPVCARHPDRVTYVLCNRCGSGICTECMVPAPVGFHCPNCVRDARATVRRIRQFVPRITYGIVGICVLMELAAQVGIGTSSHWLYEFSMHPASIAFYGEYYRLLTAVFVHANLLHLGLNMIMLWVMGRLVEQALGPWRYATLFMLAGLGGSVTSYWLSSPTAGGVGASGAIYGLMAAVFMLGRELRANTNEIAGIIGFNLVIGFVIPGVDWYAHLGGLATGAVLGWALIPHRHRIMQVLVPVAVMAVFVLAVSARTDVLLTSLLPQLLVHS